MESKVMTPEELNLLRTLNRNQSDLIYSLGQLEYEAILLNLKKENLKENIKELEKESISLGKLLTEKYGSGDINLETGEITVS
jgi:hypothetical protein